MGLVCIFAVFVASIMCDGGVDMGGAVCLPPAWVYLVGYADSQAGFITSADLFFRHNRFPVIKFWL